MAETARPAKGLAEAARTLSAQAETAWGAKQNQKAFEPEMQLVNHLDDRLFSNIQQLLFAQQHLGGVFKIFQATVSDHVMYYMQIYKNYIQ